MSVGFCKVWRPVLAAVLSGCATGAWAGASAQASITSIRFDLVDLNPSDAITPGYTIPSWSDGSGGGTWVSATVENYGQGLRPVNTNSRATSFLANLQAQSALPQGTQAQAAVNGGLLSAAALAVGESGSETHVEAVAGTYAGAGSPSLPPSGPVGALRLSPQTALTITLTGLGWADANQPDGTACRFNGGCLSEQAWAAFTLEVQYQPWFTGGFEQSYQSDMVMAEAGEFWSSVYDPETMLWAEQHYTTSTGPKQREITLTATITNASNATLTAFVNLTAQAHALGTTPLSSVPEPQTWALYGLGLLGLAGARRRRRD